MLSWISEERAFIAAIVIILLLLCFTIYIFIGVKQTAFREKDEVFGSVEAVKTVSDLFMPLSGEVIEFNEDLEDEPEMVNNDPYGKGWMIKISITDNSQIEELLDAQAYQELIGE